MPPRGQSVGSGPSDAARRQRAVRNMTYANARSASAGELTGGRSTAAQRTRPRARSWNREDLEKLFEYRQRNTPYTHLEEEFDRTALAMRLKYHHVLGEIEAFVLKEEGHDLNAHQARLKEIIANTRFPQNTRRGRRAAVRIRNTNAHIAPAPAQRPLPSVGSLLDALPAVPSQQESAHSRMGAFRQYASLAQASDTAMSNAADTLVHMSALHQAPIAAATAPASSEASSSNDRIMPQQNSQQGLVVRPALDQPLHRVQTPVGPHTTTSTSSSPCSVLRTSVSPRTAALLPSVENLISHVAQGQATGRPAERLPAMGQMAHGTLNRIPASLAPTTPSPLQLLVTDAARVDSTLMSRTQSVEGNAGNVGNTRNAQMETSSSSASKPYDKRMDMRNLCN